MYFSLSFDLRILITTFGIFRLFLQKTKKMSNMDLTNKSRWTQVLAKGAQFLFPIRYPRAIHIVRSGKCLSVIDDRIRNSVYGYNHM
jgi:hypothetical protein